MLYTDTSLQFPSGETFFSSNIKPLASYILINTCIERWYICHVQTLVGESVIIQVIIYDCGLSLWGHLQSPFLAKGREGIMDIKLIPLHGGPQGAKAWRRPRDVDVVVVVGWRVRVRVWGDRWLLLLGRGRAPRRPRPRGDSAGGRRHLVVCGAARARKKEEAACLRVHCSVHYFELHILKIHA